MPVLALIKRINSSVHSAGAGRAFRATLGKTWWAEVSSIGNKWIYNLWENHANWNDIDSKRSTSLSFQGRKFASWSNGQALIFIFFFSLRRVFLNFPILKGTNCTPKSCKRILGHSTRSRAKEYRSSLPGPWIDNNTVFSECTGTHSPD